MNTHPIAGTPTVFVRTKADHSKVRVNGIPNHPGQYVVHLGHHNDIDLHVTAAQWDVIDSKVRAGIIAAQTRAVAL